MTAAVTTVADVAIGAIAGRSPLGTREDHDDLILFPDGCFLLRHVDTIATALWWRVQ